MNAGQRRTAVGPLRFDEGETELLLSGRWFDRGSSALTEKARYLGLRQWPAGVAKNQRAIIEGRPERG